MTSVNQASIIVLLSVISGALACCPKRRDVVVKIQADAFRSNGRLVNGARCDSVFAGRSCDTQFIFCVDASPGTSGVNTCAYYRRESNRYRNDNNIVFGDNINGLPNPIPVNIPGEFEGVRLKVDVDDVDPAADDNIDSFDHVFPWYTFLALDCLGHEAAATKRSLTLTGQRANNPTELDVTVWSYCQHPSGTCEI